MIRSSRGRGRHKVFIGMAPGVGKTCRMLQEGRELLKEGTDVVIGLLETHGRQETIRQAEGLEQVPRKQLLYQGVTLEELDVAAVLERRPQLVLVDELAHTNIPGSERKKRWQDVEALLLSGLDVYSTLNIQHLESLNDLVAELTGVVVRERIPNRVLEQADEVVLVDVTPETLQERLKEGKVYAPEKVPQALANFFQRRHLVALRELSLREVADRVEEEEPTAAGLRERVMVCVSAYPSATRLLRRAARLASTMDAPLLALTIQDPGRFLSRQETLRLEACATLCQDVGGTFLRIESSDVLGTIARVARERRITQIVLGQTLRSRWQVLLRRPISERLQQLLRGLSIDLHLISDTTAPGADAEP
ncbi:osmosensitive K+ channel His kinase sensor [Cyanobium gracile]|uniref:Osmosensitive K+ channel His kinase sensor n=1 Tax=Cyanobium gracile (strain ATCC 27147 / PCC 6307) TaxID=292564 RepID=K9PA50_CYAGP|nr:osmosensitive K+ channel His kinase sensor [Cyanobium gracile]AFY30257.1 osmosensitive K+ channel His kinase sensor [Cyanobium gracile PCC 6307]